MTITKVNLNPKGDGYTSVFIDEDKFLEGDEYHDKISHQLLGARALLTFFGIKDENYIVKEINIEIDNEEWFQDKYLPKEKDTLTKYLKRLSKHFTL